MMPNINNHTGKLNYKQVRLLWISHMVDHKTFGACMCQGMQVWQSMCGGLAVEEVDCIHTQLLKHTLSR